MSLSFLGKVCVLFVIFLMNLPSSVFAQSTCDDAYFDFVAAKFDGMYVGELHGTNEAPEFIDCLVRRYLKLGASRSLVVSLELPISAHQTDAHFWHNRDGRASQRMFQLVQDLLDYEKRGQLRLHFQYKDHVTLQSGEKLGTPDQRIADSLKEAQKQGFVLALGGNFHAMKKLPSAMPLKFETAAMLLGDTWVSVNFSNIEASEFWGCSPNAECGVRTAKASITSPISDQFVEDKNGNYDRIWFARKFSASLPVFDK